MEQIGEETMGGWPICRMTLREILESLGAIAVTERGESYLAIKSSDPILDVYPATLEDDGMGYGVNEKYIIEANAFRDESPFVSMFISRDERNLSDSPSSESADVGNRK